MWNRRMLSNAARKEQNEYENNAREYPEGLIEGVGACRFCGQMATVRTLREWPEDALDEAATELCDCFAAQKYTRQKEQKIRAERSIKRLFLDAGEEPVGEETAEFLQEIAGMVIEEKISKAAVDFGNGISAAMRITAKGKIKIEKKEVKKQSSEE